MIREFPNIDNLLSELNALKKAKELLEKIYSEIGPYGDGKMEDKTRYELQDFFDFNDDE